MSVVRRNIVANIAGKGWAVVLSLAVVPVYIRVLGIEAYGLIGVFLTLIALFSLLDVGIGTAFTRQLARYSVEEGSALSMRSLLRTLEIVYWVVGVAIGALVVWIAPWVAGYWIKPAAIGADTIEETLVLMGIAVACQWPRSLYAGGLTGMQRQVALNGVASVIVTMQTLGGVLVVLHWETIQALVAWYIVTGLLDTLLTGVILWRAMPSARERARFDSRLLAEVWRFAAGMTAISVLSVILTQLDKVILSKILPLEAFGYYSLAWRVASGLYYLISPITSAFFPRFSQLVAQDDPQELARLYHRSSQLLSVAVIPVATILVVFSPELLLLWTRDPVLTDRTSAVLSLLVAGTALNGLMGLPVAVQFAYGATRLVIAANTLAVLLLAPLIYFTTLQYGGTGAAMVWLGLNAGYVLLLQRRMHKDILPRELAPWFRVDVGQPLVAAVAVAVAWKLTVPAAASHVLLLAQMAGVSLMTLMAAALAAPHIRALVAERLGRAMPSRV